MIKSEDKKESDSKAGIRRARAVGTDTSGLSVYQTSWDKLYSMANSYVNDLFKLEMEGDEDDFLVHERSLILRILSSLKYPVSPETPNSIEKAYLADFSYNKTSFYLPCAYVCKNPDNRPYLYVFHVTSFNNPKNPSDRAYRSSDFSGSADVNDDGYAGETEEHEGTHNLKDSEKVAFDEIDPLELYVPVRVFDRFIQAHTGIHNGDVSFRAEYKSVSEFSRLTWAEFLNRSVFNSENSPRWVILATPYQWVLVERTKFVQRRLLRFNWKQLFTRKEKRVLQAVSVLVGSEAFDILNGSCRLDSLDESSFRHAQGVSDSLKYTMRRSIERLGNAAVDYLVKNNLLRKPRGKDLAEQLSAELLRYMYRLLMLFFIESRPELKYVPTNDENYELSYSIESLRELEDVPLIKDEDRNGAYFHSTIQNLFNFISKGVNGGDSRSSSNLFSIQKLDSRLFDDSEMKLLSKVVFPNYILQDVIRWLSLSVSNDKNARTGRISYAHLGINQLGAVYETLLSYRGFFADRDLYEVKKADSKGNELDTAYFVSASELDNYSEEERVFEYDPVHSAKKLRKYPKDSFIYRMSGRARETSASYYTPETLTRCVVKYSVDELSRQQLDQLATDKERAERILSWRICEPAMGSAAFLNEATNQLAELYMKYAMKIPGAPALSQKEYRDELQKVKMYIADRNLYGVDLNPTAVELAEISIWLNTLSADCYVPNFIGQLQCGNSLIGCRREAFFSADLKKSIKKAKPHRVGSERLPEGQIWHFLVPGDRMAFYDNKDIKSLKSEEIADIGKWSKNFCKPFTDEEIELLENLSQRIEDHWQNYARQLGDIRNLLKYPRSIYQHEETVTGQNLFTSLERKEKSEIFKKVQNKDEPFDFAEFSRLRNIMNYWCALWFWPISEAQILPTRKEFISDVIDQLDAIDKGSSIRSELFESGVQQEMFTDEKSQNELFEADGSQAVSDSPKSVSENISSAEKERRDRRAAVVVKVDQNIRFLHWPLRFADFFITGEDGYPGFDLTLGNPPWAVVSFNETAVLGDIDPEFVIHDKKYNAKAVQDILLGKMEVNGNKFFERYRNAEEYLLSSYEATEGARNFFNDEKLYPEMKGCRTDLFKIFLPNVWRNSAGDGVQGLLHPETPYTETNANMLREEIYHRIRKHFQFDNELKLFADVHHQTQFSVNIYGSYKKEPDFYSINNLFVPGTIDDSINADINLCSYEIEGRKDDKGNWNTRGHPDRVLHIDHEALRKIAKIFSGDEKAPVLPNIHARSLLSILEHFADCSRLGKISPKISSMWNETTAQQDGTIRKFAGNQTAFPSCPGNVVLNGVHINVGNPLFKIPDNPCSNNLQWSAVDLTEIPDDYLPRCKYEPNVSDEEYHSRMDKTPEGEPVDGFYRFAYREMVGCDSERTFAGAIIPGKYTHIGTLNHVLLKKNLPLFSAVVNSITVDYFIRTLNNGHLHPNVICSIPFPPITHLAKELLISRGLALNCLTVYYSELWEEYFDESFNDDAWLDPDPVLNQDFFRNLTPEWQRSCALRTDLERRQALLEIDVIVARAFGLSLEELLTCYRLGFRVMRSYDENTYYDQNGRIVFTSNSSLGVGLPGSAKKNDGAVYTVRGTVRNNGLGFDDVRDLKSGEVTKTYTDDTLPGGPRMKKVTYKAPFFRKNREADYARAWKAYEELCEE